MIVLSEVNEALVGEGAITWLTQSINHYVIFICAYYLHGSR